MKQLMILIALVFFLAFSYAEESMVIQAKITVMNGEVIVDDIHVVYGTPSENDSDGRHIAQLLDRDLSTLYQLRFFLDKIEPTLPETIPPEKYDEFIAAETSYEALIYFPYLEGAEIIALGAEDGNLMAFVGIKDIICNNNGECDDGENFLSCEQDCPLEEEDNYCLPVSEGVCDPDCIEGLDEDCSGTGSGNGSDLNGSGGTGLILGWLSMTEIYFIASLLLVIVFIVFYNFVLKKKR